MSKNKDKRLTSVKVEPPLFDEFKVASIRTKIPLQKLVDRSMYLFLTDSDFRSKIMNQFTLSLSGSVIL